MKKRGPKFLYKTKMLSITLREDVIDWLDRVSAVNNRSRSNLINAILMDKMSFGTEIEIAGGIQKVIIPAKGSTIPAIVEDITNEAHFKRTQERLKDINKSKPKCKGRPKKIK